MLVNCPLVDQLHEPTLDGGPDEGMYANCVPASLSSALMALNPGYRYDGDELRDAVYGEGYTGATDPARYVQYCASQGVTLAEVRAGQAALVAAIVAALQAHRPVTGAIPSMWATAPADPVHAVGSTHEVVWCDFDGTNLTAMNPWPLGGVAGAAGQAFYQTQPLAWWQARIVYGRVFTMERTGNMVPAGWHDDGTTLTAPNGGQLTGQWRRYVLGESWNPACVPVLQPTAANPHAVERTTDWGGEVVLSDGHEETIIFRWNRKTGAYWRPSAADVIAELWGRFLGAAAGGASAAKLAALEQAIQAALAAAA